MKTKMQLRVETFLTRGLLHTKYNENKDRSPTGDEHRLRDWSIPRDNGKSVISN